MVMNYKRIYFSFSVLLAAIVAAWWYLFHAAKWPAHA